MSVRRLSCFLMAICVGCLTAVQCLAQRNEKEAPLAISKIPDGLLAGIGTSFEDFSERFNTYGGFLSYVHPVKSRLGVMADAGYYLGNMDADANYSKFLLHGGLCLVPRPGRIFISPHILAGITHDRIKYQFDNFSSTSQGTIFSLIAGTNVTIPINNKTSVVARVDYNPSFSDMETKNNFNAGLGVNINIGRAITKATNNENHSSYSTTTKERCHADKNVKELKFTMTAIEDIAKSVEEVANKIPRVEAKVYVRPEVNIRRGEECCSYDKPPATWTEIRGGVEGGFEVNINLWGLPDLNYSLKLWPVLLIAQFQCKLFWGPTGKISLEPVGKFYGELLGEKRPDCQACFYWNLKAEGFVRVGVKAGGKVSLYHWSPLAKGGAGFDVTGEPDETLEVSGEASASLGETFSGTYVNDPGCQNPEQGLHGIFKLGKAKANLKFTVKLGPLSCDPSFELNIFDGFQFPF